MRRFWPTLIAVVGIGAAIAAALWLRETTRPHNVIIFVADGLRSGVVTPETAPDLAAVRGEGVDFQNSHSLFPTVTTPNASAIATGHRLGDTGDFGNSIYTGQPALPSAFLSLAATFEDDAVIGDMNGRYGGNYLGETSLLAAARAKGFSTAAIGKLGPTAIQDVTSRGQGGSLIIDDNTGGPTGFPLPADVVNAIKAAGLDPTTPDRGLNADPGDDIRPGVRVANVVQQDWLVNVATKVLLPRFKAARRPFVMVFWSLDPDGTQHNQGDSLNTITPGINGPTSMAAIRNASNDLGRLRQALKALGLDKTTDVVVTADHGFSTASKASATSAAAKMSFRDVPTGFLPPGFLAIDLSRTLGLPLYDPNGLNVELSDGFHPKHGGMLGADPAHPEAVIGANGGADLIWLPGADAKALAPRMVEALAAEDYVGAIFVNDALGEIPGTLPLSAIGLKGSALTPTPAIVVSFRSYSSGCPKPDVCGVEVADTDLQQGQGIHGTFGRADTHNFMAAIGPDFKTGFLDPSPVSNADLAVTLAKVLRLYMRPRGGLSGRVLSESLRGGEVVASSPRTIRSRPAKNGFVTVLNEQAVGDQLYYDDAGAPGRTLGLRP
ncbi:MAG TPA: alkaline phosphatase family protein [Caulobacteraceae bacterium]|nr:alkaline phosphatase family protein [Caulobacteraceae bacterium]